MDYLRKQYDKMSPAVRTSVWFTFCNFLQRGLSFLTVPVFTRLLTTEEYGICNVYFAWFEVFVLFTSLKIPYEGLNNGLIRYEKDKDGYTSSVMGLVMSLTVVMFGVYHLVKRWIDSATGLGGCLMLLMFVQLMFQPALMLWINRQRFDFEYRKPVIVTVLSTVWNLVITVLAVLNTTYKAEARIGGFVIVQSFFGMVSAVILLVRGKTFYKKEYWKFALGFNLPLVFYYISQMVMGQSDRILINYFAGSGKAAVYGVAYSAATIVQLAISSVNGSLYPWIYKKLKEKKIQEIRSMASKICMFVGGITLLAGLLAPDIVRIMATEEYMEAVWIIAPVSAGVFFSFLYMLFASVEMYYGENRGISLISILCSVINIFLNFVGIQLFGYYAAGWVTLLSYIFLALLHDLLMRRICRSHHISGGILDERFLAVISAGVILMSFAVMALYRLGNVRYIVLLLIIVTVCIFRKKLYRLLRQIRKGETNER